MRIPARLTQAERDVKPRRRAISKSETLKELVAEMQRHGVTEYLVDRSGKHHKLRFEFSGRQIMVVYPATPSDHRGVLNAVASLRGAMGVKRVVTKSQRPARPANHRKPPCADPVLRPVPLGEPVIFTNPWAPLAILRERLRG
jgi:hypothetical protein